MGSEIEDPNLADLPDEAYEEVGEEGLNVPQLELRIRAKREQAMQDAGLLSPPGPDEPIEEVPEEEPESEPVEPEEPEQEQQEDFFFGRYKTREEAERGHAEKDATIDRLYRERAERGQQQEQQAQGEEQGFDPQAWSEWAAEAVANGAAEQGAMAALNAPNGGERALDIYIAHWMDDPDQRGQALAFNNAATRHLATQLALQAVAPILQDRQAQEAEREAVRARATLASRHPDYEEMEREMDRLVLEENGVLDDDQKQWLEDTAREKGFQGKVHVLEYLYSVASQTTTPQRRKAQAAERGRRKAASDAAKVSATVSSSEATGTRTPLSEAELAVRAKKNAIRAKLGQPLLPTE